ncbi:MAG: hypothetical protein JO262_21525 [Solirubrobacterales bacterium]|nr:hypothetical protein [Solirubrobacterales bacterium]
MKRRRGVAYGRRCPPEVGVHAFVLGNRGAFAACAFVDIAQSGGGVSQLFLDVFVFEHLPDVDHGSLGIGH